MGEIPTHPHALLMPLPCGPVVAGVVITELNVVMNVLAYGLRPRPTTMYLTEHGPGVVRQLLRVGIPAAKQILECLVGEDFNSPLLGIGHNWVRLAGVSNDEFIVKLKQSGESYQTCIEIAEGVVKVPQL